MPQLTTPGGVTLEYETHGSATDPPVLMVMGIGSQLIAWPRGFSQQVADGGRYVITYDNRDSGLSQRFDGIKPDLERILGAASEGDFDSARALVPYTFSDMSDDGLGLLTALGIERAHVVGASMGGMIAQTMAIEHPDRVITLTSMMSTTGERDYGQSTPEAQVALLTPSPADREGNIEAADRYLLWHSKRYPERDAMRQLEAESYDRANYPEGFPRQLAALIASGQRAAGLATLDVPTLVIHGLDDTLVAPSGGERTAELIPGAELMLVPDMGHDRPRQLWPELVGAILRHTAL